MAAYEKIKLDVADGVATITLDDPETRNALSDQLLSELARRAAGGQGRRRRPRRRARLLAREGVLGRAATWAASRADAPTAHKYFATGLFPQVFIELGELGKPSIVAASGHVLAGSLGIALACDLIVAKDTAGFGTPEINVGLFPFMIMALIYRNVPRKKTTEMLLLGERLTAEEAREAGIVNKVVPAEEFDAAVAEWAQKLASKSPLVMKLGKDAMWRQLDMPLLRRARLPALPAHDRASDRGRDRGRHGVLRKARARMEGTMT